MKNLVFLSLTVLILCSFQQASTIEKTLKDINNNFKNMEVTLVNWPNSLQPQLGDLKKTAFMAFPKTITKKKLPLLISLHGGGGKTWTVEEQLKRSAKVKGLSLAELAGKELILLEPNSSKKWNPDTLNVMLDYILETHPEIDTNRIYLIGHSMGGIGIWNWILKSPNRFAAVAPSGFRGINEQDDVSKLAKLPVWGMVGGNDEKNVEPIKKMVALLENEGNTNVKYTVFPGANHAKGNAMVFSATECVEWMLNFSTN